VQVGRPCNEGGVRGGGAELNEDVIYLFIRQKAKPTNAKMNSKKDNEDVI
jgi:hypothetical protein